MAKLSKAAVLAVLCVALPANADAPREVNVTSDSQPGWYPSVEQSEAAERAARGYLAAEDAGKVEEAYPLLSDLNRQHLSFVEYKMQVGSFNARAGTVIERRFVKVAWTKDSPDAPLPGIYAAIDLASRFANVDRHCGYLILYQSNEGGDFTVMREEAAILENSAAADILRRGSQSDVDKLWAQLSANCPNYSETPK